MQVRDVMTTQLITVTENQTKQQAARLLSQHRISGLPVVNKDQSVVGVVTEYDVIARQGDTVRDIMTHNVISVSAEADLEEVARILVDKQIKRLLVLNQGKLVGIVSRADLVREVAQRWVCHVCGETTHSDTAPESCPRCGARETTDIAETIIPGS